MYRGPGYRRKVHVVPGFLTASLRCQEVPSSVVYAYRVHELGEDRAIEIV